MAGKEKIHHDVLIKNSISRSNLWRDRTWAESVEKEPEASCNVERTACSYLANHFCACNIYKNTFLVELATIIPHKTWDKACLILDNPVKQAKPKSKSMKIDHRLCGTRV